MRPNESHQLNQQLHSSHRGDDPDILSQSSTEQNIECVDDQITTKQFQQLNHEDQQENQDTKTTSISKESKNKNLKYRKARISNNQVILSCPVSIPLKRLDQTFIHEIRNKYKAICGSSLSNRSNIRKCYLGTESFPQSANVNQEKLVPSDEE